jgi:hypothetical protein
MVNDKPLLSILCQGRNDSYMGNFTWRLSTILNKHAENIAILGLENEVELIVSDWGSESPLHLSLELNENARRFVKYLITPPETAAIYDRDAGFSIVHAINAIARRCQGKYILFSDSDVFLPMETMAKLMHFLRRGYFHSFDLRDSFFWASKFHIPNDFIADSPCRELVDEHIQRNWPNYVRETVDTENFLGCGVCLLMSRDMWFESTGWDERLIYMGWNDIDFTRRLLSKYRWDDLENHGMSFFHLEHYRDRFNPNYATESNKKWNAHVDPTTFAPNAPNWGLADHDLRFVDGYGLPIDPATGRSRSGAEHGFDQSGKLLSVQEMVAGNPLYRTVAERFAFDPHSWFTNAEAVNALLQALQPHTVCEIGSWMGSSARCFAAAPTVTLVACVDHWDRYRVEKYKPGLHPERLMNNMYEQFLANAVHTGSADKLCPIRLDSHAAAEYCARTGQRFDLIYVDGDHTSVGAKTDILKWSTLLSEGGYLCGDDWTWQKEPDNVAGAVVSAAREKGWQVYYHGNFWLVIPGEFSVQPLSFEVLQGIKPIQRASAARKPSQLDSIIPPEIQGDEFYNLIIELARTQQISTVLEIGSSAGGGSTEAFVTGLAANPCAPKLFCMEVSQPRFEQLAARYADQAFVSCYHTSSVTLASFATPEQVTAFHQSTQTNLSHYPLPQILGWLQQDIDYVKGSGLDEDGIGRIRREHGIGHFDMVLIDGSEFTGASELDRVYGAQWLLLDDVNAFKNYQNYRRLRNDPGYELYRENWQLRNGYAVFKKKSDELPVHFFTIVLNGMPFVRYHIDVLRQLPFRWHWHVVEGVADLVHDTAWSKQMGGHIPEMCHRDGLSLDGTSEYLDELKAQFPDQITVYRKPKGHLWDGKLEMVQAPVAALSEECLLWQVDVDEFWTAEQMVTARRMFVENPEKTAAYYWCHFFVGERLVVNSRNCYSQNPAMEWLRTWRYTPGDQWIAHEPPRLHRPLPDGSSCDLSRLQPLLHDQTEALGLVFQHFAYVLPEQLRFKESYYGYRGALACWQRLQEQKSFPVLLRDFFPWVGDHTSVVPVEVQRVVPIKLPAAAVRAERKLPVTVVDGVFFQMNNTGIARLWRSILCEWAKTEFGRSILVLDRMGTAPRIPGLRYRNVPGYDHQPQGWDRTMLQQVCTEEGADLFMSTYYTTPLSTPSVFLAYDMIPEFTNFYDLSDAQWQEKHHAIQRSSAVIAISRSTANDLGKLYPELAGRVAVAHCGLDREQFYPASAAEIRQLKERHGIDKPYFLFIGSRNGYKNGKLVLEAFTRLPDKHNYLLLYVGGNPALEPSFRAVAGDADVRVVPLNDAELRVAYSGAVAFVYPSMYEGFGLPVLEAMGCGCPVITCQNSSLPEVAGGAALFVSPEDPDQLTTALQQVQIPEVRQGLIGMGSRQALKFTWENMAEIMQGVICNQVNSASA